MIKRGMFMLALASSVVATAQTLDVDWLYLSDYGSWISRTKTVLKQQDALKLPVESLSIDQFYWHSNAPKTQLVWQTPNPSHLPTIGSSVEIKGESGLWLVQAVNPSHLILQQGSQVRYWPQSQWHQLAWTQTQDVNLTLQVLQPSSTRNTIFYAWQTPLITANIAYRLAEDTLYQELILSNQTNETYQSEGYSFAQTSSRPVFQAAKMTVMNESLEMVSAPSAGESQGVPTLYSDRPLTLKAGSNVWLPVSQVSLDKVERQYTLSWDSRQTGLQRAETSLLLSAKALPDIPGQIKIGVFDNQLAIQNTYYQPSSTTQARLDLGQSALVTMTSRQVRDTHWQLAFSNRSSENAVIALTVNHWDGKKVIRTPMTVKVSANDEKKIDLELTPNGLKHKS